MTEPAVGSINRIVFVLVPTAKDSRILSKSVVLLNVVRDIKVQVLYACCECVKCDAWYADVT